IALTLASMVGRDVYRASMPSAGDAAELTVGKIVIVVVIAAAALFASLQLDLISLLSVASSAGLLVIVPAIVGAFFWRRSTAPGALWSIVGGTIAVVGLGTAGINPWGVPYAVVAFALTGALFVGTSLLTRPPVDRGKAFIDDLKPHLERLEPGGP